MSGAFEKSSTLESYRALTKGFSNDLEAIADTLNQQKFDNVTTPDSGLRHYEWLNLAPKALGFMAVLHLFRIYLLDFPIILDRMKLLTIGLLGGIALYYLFTRIKNRLLRNNSHLNLLPKANIFIIVPFLLAGYVMVRDANAAIDWNYEYFNNASVKIRRVETSSSVGRRDGGRTKRTSHDVRILIDSCNCKDSYYGVSSGLYYRLYRESDTYGYVNANITIHRGLFGIVWVGGIEPVSRAIIRLEELFEQMIKDGDVSYDELFYFKFFIKSVGSTPENSAFRNRAKELLESAQEYR